MEQPSANILLDLLVEFRRNQEKAKEQKLLLSNNYCDNQQKILETIEDLTFELVEISQVQKLAVCHKQLQDLFEAFERDFKASYTAFQLISGQYFEKRKKLASEVDFFWMQVLKGAHERLGVYAVTKVDEGPLRHLLDVQLILEEDSSFMLKFIFSPNDFFDNDELCKCYQPIEGNTEGQFSSSSGAIFFKQKVPNSRNFFNFFRNTHDNRNLDSLVGKFFRDSIVPSAILYYNMYNKKIVLY